MPGEVCLTTEFTFAGIHVDGHIGQRGHGMNQLMPDRFGDAMAVASGHLTIHCDVKLGALAMTDPTHGDVVYFHHICYPGRDFDD